MAELRNGATLGTLEAAAGYELGVIRISFGLSSNWEDVWAVVRWARSGVASGWEGFRDLGVGDGCGVGCANASVMLG